MRTHYNPEHITGQYNETIFIQFDLVQDNLCEMPSPTFLEILDHEESICSLIPPAMGISIARTTKGNNSKGPGPMAIIFFPTIQLVILVMCTKFQVSR